MPGLITGIWHIFPVKVNSSGIYVQGQNSTLRILAITVTCILHTGNVSLLSLLSKLSLHYESSLPKKKKKKVISTKGK